MAYKLDEHSDGVTVIRFESEGIEIAEHAWFNIAEEFRGESSHDVIQKYRFGSELDADGSYFDDLLDRLQSGAIGKVVVE